MMTPKEIESFVLRMTGEANYTGVEANKRKFRFGLQDFGDPNVFDCDDRAEIARRIAVKEGYLAHTSIQAMPHPPNHRYLVLLDENNVSHEILKRPV